MDSEQGKGSRYEELGGHPSRGFFPIYKAGVNEETGGSSREIGGAPTTVEVDVSGSLSPCYPEDFGWYVYRRDTRNPTTSGSHLPTSPPSRADRDKWGSDWRRGRETRPGLFLFLPFSCSPTPSPVPFTPLLLPPPSPTSSLSPSVCRLSLFLLSPLTEHVRRVFVQEDRFPFIYNST